jgi:hypothetical protein
LVVIAVGVEAGRIAVAVPEQGEGAPSPRARRQAIPAIEKPDLIVARHIAFPIPNIVKITVQEGERLVVLAVF